MKAFYLLRQQLWHHYCTVTSISSYDVMHPLPAYLPTSSSMSIQLHPVCLSTQYLSHHFIMPLSLLWLPCPAQSTCIYSPAYASNLHTMPDVLYHRHFTFTSFIMHTFWSTRFCLYCCPASISFFSIRSR